MDKKYIYIFFVLMVLAQLFVPLRMIFSSEKIINSERNFKFKTVPRDPVDPFRGKYITLRFEVEQIGYPIDTVSIHKDYSRPLYAYLKEDQKGYCQIDTIVINQKNDKDFLIIKLP